MRNYHILIDRKHTVNTTLNVARLVFIEVIGKSKGGWIILSTTVDSENSLSCFYSSAFIDRNRFRQVYHAQVFMNRNRFRQQFILFLLSVEAVIVLDNSLSCFYLVVFEQFLIQTSLSCFYLVSMDSYRFRQHFIIFPSGVYKW